MTTPPNPTEGSFEEFMSGAMTRLLRFGYVRRAMVNTHTSLWRRGRRESPLPEGFDEPSSLGDPTDHDEADTLVRAMRVLPPRRRAVVVLRYYDDLTEAETARVMGCAVGTVKSQASRALRTLRVELECHHSLEETTS